MLFENESETQSSPFVFPLKTRGGEKEDTHVGRRRWRRLVFGRCRGLRKDRARRRVDGRGDAVLGRLVGRVPGREAQRFRP